ncbi:Uncharacterised protein [Mycobacterium tuberculosis]|nr:Uncharacterised protein [Mycobacterium tuberculosis]
MVPIRTRIPWFRLRFALLRSASWMSMPHRTACSARANAIMNPSP